MNTTQHPRTYPINNNHYESMVDAATGDPNFEANPAAWEIDWCWEKIAQLTTALQIERERTAHLKQFKEWSK